jgi:hypothetical protein
MMRCIENMPDDPSLAYIAISPSRTFQIHGCILHASESNLIDPSNVPIEGEVFVSCLCYRRPEQPTFEEIKAVVQREIARQGGYIHYTEAPDAERLFAAIEQDMENGLDHRIRINRPR